MTEERDPSDLGAAVRRRPLSRTEEAELERLVESSTAERVLHYAGYAFDRDSSARPGDDVLIQRIAARAAASVNTLPTRATRASRRPRVLLLAAALVIAGSAVAATTLYLGSTPEPRPQVAPRKAPAPPANGPGPAALARETSPLAEPSTQTRRDSPSPTTLSARPLPRPSEPTAPKLAGAPALFEEANRRRLAGDTPRAIVLYRQLVEHHPASAEAALAQLSLGKLLLAQGDAERALAAFRAGAAQRSALSAEALWGEAGALRALGREKEEHAVLARLLARFPSGVYAGAARKRLGSSSP
jgi:TolA-binding protein